MAWRKDVRIPHYVVDFHNFIDRKSYDKCLFTLRWRKPRNNTSFVFTEKDKYDVFKMRRVLRFGFKEHTYYYYIDRAISKEEADEIIEIWKEVGEFSNEMWEDYYELVIGFFEKLKWRNYKIDFIMALQLVDLCGFVVDEQNFAGNELKPKIFIEQMVNELIRWANKEYKKRGRENINYMKLFEDFYL